MSARKPATLLARALGWVEQAKRGVVPPIYTSASYVRDADGTYPGGHSYTRDQSPAYDQAEALLSALENAQQTLLFASGMAAATTVLDALEPGDRIVAPDGMYWTIRGWIERLGRRQRATVDWVPTGDLEALARAVLDQPTSMVWLESPSNPMAVVTDLEAAAAIARRAGAVTIADNTLATPLLTRPLDLGVDIVMHSATKQLNGHSDVVAGALSIRRDPSAQVAKLWDHVKHERGYRGAILGPFESWLLLRGMRTLALRVDASNRNAFEIAHRLEGHAQISSVLYAGLASNPGHLTATRQMTGGFGSVVSIRLRGGAQHAREVLSRLELFHDASSLGSVESLVEHRARTEGDASRVPDDLLRLSMGIEDGADLLADLEQALGK